MIVFSHGWNNDMDDARAMYTEFFGNFAADMTKDDSLSKRRFGIVGVLWPSKKFADSELFPETFSISAEPPALERLREEKLIVGTDVTATPPES